MIISSPQISSSQCTTSFSINRTQKNLIQSKSNPFWHAHFILLTMHVGKCRIYLQYGCMPNIWSNSESVFFLLHVNEAKAKNETKESNQRDVYKQSIRRRINVSVSKCYQCNQFAPFAQVRRLSSPDRPI